MKPGDRVIWLRSPGRSFATGWRVQRIPGIVVGVSRHHVVIGIRIGVQLRIANINPENLICGEDAGGPSSEMQTTG